MSEQPTRESKTGQTPRPAPSARKSGRSKKGRLPRPSAVKLAVLIGFVLLLLIAGMAIGYFLAPRSTVAAHGDAGGQTAPAKSGPTTWTCSMHPQFKLPGPGKCPICFMDLIPLEQDTGEDLGPRQLRMSATAAALAEIETTPVVRRYATGEVRMVGKVDYDETRLADITAWVPGRLDRLYVDYTGVTVRKGDHLVSMYSPNLVVAQRELLQAVKSAERLGSLDPKLGAATLASAEEKLRLLGLLPEQIDEIKRQGTPTDQLTIYAPAGGIVIRKHTNEGTYVRTGTKIYTIADLSVVWVYLQAYESDIPWLRYEQDVEFSTEAYPGEIFHGRVAFIDPMLDERTRTVRVRVNVPNPDGNLKPGMFVRALVRSHIAAGGRVFDASLAGKWICPMHPEVVKDGSGQCDVCGMDLVPAKELGYVLPDKAPEMPLLIPATAPLITGKRAVVYVRLPDRDQPTFEGREVLLGVRAGDHYLVRHGLEEGELVVTHGNFKIDSALEIQAKPSMMSPAPLDVPPAFHGQLAAVYDAYLALQTALADDRLDEAGRAFVALRQAVGRIDTSVLEGRTLRAWQTAAAEIEPALETDSQAADLDQLRERFEPISEAMLGVVDAFGHTREAALHKAFCPMAFKNKGAAWLQAGEKIANPYFGHKMLRCGEIQRDFPPVGTAQREDDRTPNAREEGAHDH
ncbi:MAG TPA: efflux RND transporter periplasmic adaptor subunit [Thermoguttaceae bacterium]|nr:efflux RND transporter periplasmic adaptor subunit [Thermoguttaceae bacterium]